MDSIDYYERQGSQYFEETIDLDMTDHLRRFLDRLPENAEVLNVTIADRICYVAFDGVFSSYALDVSEKIPVYSVVNSLLDALDADKVQITVGGKDRLDTFGKKMELYHFYERNDKLVVKEKE